MKKADLLLTRCALELLSQTHLEAEAQFIQHGSTSTLLHSLAVAYYGLWLAGILRLAVSRRSLVRGALLHDYYLYDWHDPASHARLHGFHHPRVAWKNAMRDAPMPLNAIEQDIILKHMFPMTLRPPAYRESAIICLTDKLCALYETVCRRRPYRRLQALMEQWEVHSTKKHRPFPIDANCSGFADDACSGRIPRRPHS